MGTSYTPDEIIEDCQQIIDESDISTDETALKAVMLMQNLAAIVKENQNGN